MTQSIHALCVSLSGSEHISKVRKDAYTAGYIQALQDNGLLLTDIPISDLATEYLCWVHKESL